MAGSKIKQSNCLICYKLVENVTAAGKKEIEEPLQLKVFQNYCQLLKVQSVNVKWNFRTDGYIYCPECYIEMASLVDLNDRMKKIKNSIDKILMSTKFTILNTKENSSKDKISGKPLRRIDYLRDVAVKEFEPHLRILKVGIEKLIPSPNGYQIIEPVPKPKQINNNSLPKSKVGDVLLSSLAIQQPDKLIIKKEKGLISTQSTNPKSIIRIPISSSIRSSPRTQLSSVAKPESKTGKSIPRKVPPAKKEWETIDLLSSDDEEKDPDFLASSSEDELESVSEKCWKEESVSSSVNNDGVPVRKSARTKRKSIKMIEADNDNSQAEISSSNSSNPLNKKPRLAIEDNNNINKYKCGDCAYSFTSKKSLMKHMKILNHRPYDEMFSKDSNEENKNFESDHQEEYSSRKKAEQYPFECKICWTRHATLMKLRSHEKDHYGKKTYKCTRGNCQLSFTDTVLLDEHIKKVHANENEKCLLAFMDNSNAKEIDLDIDLSFLDENPVRNVPSPTPEESFRIIEDDPMFRLDIDEPIIRPEENEPMSFEAIDYTDSTPIDYSGGHFSFFDQLSQSQSHTTQGVYYL